MLDPDPASDPAQMAPAEDPFQGLFQNPLQDPVQDPLQVPSQTTSPTPKDPNVSRTKTGLLLLIAAIILATGLVLVNSLFPLLLDQRLSYLVAVPLLLGAALVFVGRRAWPAHRRSAVVGLALMVAGEGSAIVLGLLGYPYLLSLGPPMDVGSPYHQALLFRLIWEAVNLILVTVGTLLLVWRITSEAPRKLIVGGNLAFLGYYLAGHMLTVVLYDPNVGGINLVAQPAVGILLGLFLVVLLVTNAVQAFGLVVARWRLPIPMSTG